jgi:integrase
VVDLGGCGTWQGEIFGLSVDDLDLDTGWLQVRRQVKRVYSRLVFGLPKNDKERRVPLPASIAASLRAYLDEYPPVRVTLPWEDPQSDELATVPLIFVTSRRGAINRSHFNGKIWHPALEAVGIPQTRATGMHALRHFYASTLLDVGRASGRWRRTSATLTLASRCGSTRTSCRRARNEHVKRLMRSLRWRLL